MAINKTNKGDHKLYVEDYLYTYPTPTKMLKHYTNNFCLNIWNEELLLQTEPQEIPEPN